MRTMRVLPAEAAWYSQKPPSKPAFAKQNMRLDPLPPLLVNQKLSTAPNVPAPGTPGAAAGLRKSCEPEAHP